MIINKIISFSGADKDLLNQCSTEKNKYLCVGLSILLTAIMAGISGAYVIYFTFENIFISIAFGLLWGSIIFNLDRFIVTGISKKENNLSQLKIAIPRIILSVFLAITISKPIELKLFEASINKQIHENSINNKKSKEVYFDSLKKVLVNELRIAQFNKNDSYNKDEILSDFNNQKEILVNNIESVKNKIKINSSKKDTVFRKKNFIVLNKSLSELNSKLTEIESLIKKRKTSLSFKIESSEINNIKQINNLNTRIREIDSTRQDVIKRITKSSEHNDILDRLAALSEVKNKSITANIAGIIITFLFIIIEVSPILIKLILKKGLYDELLEIYEQKSISDYNNHLLNCDKIKKYNYDIEFRTNQTITDYQAKKNVYLGKVKVDKEYDLKLKAINNSNGK